MQLLLKEFIEEYTSDTGCNQYGCDGVLNFVWHQVRSICSFLKFYLITYYVYLRRQQERGLMQKAKHLMDENSISFQMFLILLSSITLGSESQISVFKQGQSNT